MSDWIICRKCGAVTREATTAGNCSNCGAQVIFQQHASANATPDCNTCVCCGNVIPEGRQVCVQCEKREDDFIKQHETAWAELDRLRAENEKLRRDNQILEQRSVKDSERIFKESTKPPTKKSEERNRFAKELLKKIRKL